MFKKILVANRGEIAVRVIRACKELNIPTVAVHSDVDHDSMHVRLAEESICIGSHKPQNSYLNIAAIMSAADVTGADAIHPGYGFLSENYHFAEIVEKNKLKFIGPSAEIMKKMGDKIEAKRTAKTLGLPVIEGAEGNINSLEEAKNYNFSPQEEALRQYNRQRCVWGTAEEVRNGILSLGDTYKVDEFVILTICSKFEARCHSYELLAEAFGLTPRGI